MPAPMTTQAKSISDTPGDVYEEEAEGIAEQVMRMPDSAGPDKASGGACCSHAPPGKQEEEAIHTEAFEGARQRKCAACEAQDKRRASTPDAIATVSPNAHPGAATSRDGGAPLPARMRRFFEPRFGCDFSRVRIHTDSRGAAAARALGARAFTTGTDIVFGAGQYAPETSQGKRLLAHELAHTLQQAGGAEHARQSRVQRFAERDDPLSGTLFAGDPVLEAVSRGERLLTFGSRGEPIRKLQGALIDVGFPLPRFGADGDFGSETKNAVLGFQRSSGLTGNDVDGIVGPITLGLLARAIANVIEQKKEGGCAELERPIDDSEPVFMCSAPLKALDIGIHHAFFRVGSEKVGCGPTYSLFPLPVSDTCVQGRPGKSLNSDLQEANASCIKTSLKWSCLDSESSRYPWGYYCSLSGPNSNTYVGVMARSCGDQSSTPPKGVHPGLDGEAPKKETASRVPFALIGVICGPDPFCKAPKGQGH